jgi:hypothetical protein
VCGDRVTVSSTSKVESLGVAGVPSPPSYWLEEIGERPCRLGLLASCEDANGFLDDFLSLATGMRSSEKRFFDSDDVSRLLVSWAARHTESID